MAAQIECRLEPVANVGQVERAWRDLQDRANCSYFLTWSWIGTWLRQLPENLRPMLFTAVDSGRVIGLAILISRHLLRHRVIRSNALFLNKTGDEALDEITIEYNGLLAEPQRRTAVTEAALNFFLSQQWDEVFIDAAHDSESVLALNGKGWTPHRRKAWRAYGVDLQKLRETGTEFLDAIGSNTRYQVRRALRSYAHLGTLHVEVASGQGDADAWLSELRRLHQASWTAKGLPGAFGNTFLDRFHRELVAERMVHGEIQLLRVSFGECSIGYLYNFLWNGAVLNYQSGFDYNLLPKHNWPGAITHFAAIEFNRLQGARYYDFLGGDSQQKRTLSTTSLPLDWVVARRKCMKFGLEDGVRSIRDRLLGNRRMAEAEELTED